MRSKTLWTLAAILLLLAGGVTGWAEEEEPGDSPAAKAYQAGFWAETATGALDEARARYEEALRSEGPAPVKARALYRLGIVLERSGKTQEAIRTLERLVKEFPAQAALHAQARERLEAWTAVDLRTSFSEWYERYRYSPAFQAHVVELVLKLSVEGAGRTQATQELLAIGAPAVQALRAHLDSSNESLREGAVSILLRLGEIPSAKALAETTSWTQEGSGWAVLLRSDPGTWERLRGALPPKAPLTPLLSELLRGIDHIPAALGIDPQERLLLTALDLYAGDLAAPLLAMVDTPAPAGGYDRGKLAHTLRSRGLVSDDRALEWLRTGPPVVRRYVSEWISKKALRHPRAWESLVVWLQSLATKDQDVSTAFFALRVALDRVPDGADLSVVVHEVERLWSGGRVALPSVPATGRRGTRSLGAGELRLLRAVIEGTSDERILQRALLTWVAYQALEPAVSLQLLTWAQREHSIFLRRWLMKAAGECADDESLDLVLAAAGAARPDLAAPVLDGLDDGSLTASDWTAQRLGTLLALVTAAPAGSPVAGEGRNLLVALLHPPQPRSHLLDLAFAEPSAFPRYVLQRLPSQSLRDAGFVAGLQARLMATWEGWSPGQRNDVLWLFDEVWKTIPPQSELEAFLRNQLHAGPVRGEQATALARSLVRQLPAPTLDDVGAAFDLSTPQGAHAAMKLSALPKTPATYAALQALTKHPEASVRLAYYRAWLVVEELESRIFRDQVADPDDEVRVQGLQGLLAQGRNDAVPLLVKALADEDASVRTAAAKALGILYDRGAIQALAGALDDAYPEVRAAALQSLEAIQKVEEQKAYWKKFAEGK